MEENRQFIGGLPNQDIDEAQLQDALHNMLKQTAQSGGPALGVFGTLQQRRADRLNTAAKALGKEIGIDHPDVIAMQATAKSVAQMNVTMDAQTTRLKTWTKIRANEWTVFGTVISSDNKPASGMTVRVFDKDRKYDDLLGETETDENGDFSIIYHERDFKETHENFPELYVMVSDAKGNQVYSSRDSVRFNSGQSEYFAIQLGKQTRATKTAKTSVKKSASPTTKASARKK